MGEPGRPLTAADIKRQARALGFDACGIAPAADHPELKFFKEWLARGYAGNMGYLPRSAERRADVRRVMPSAQSVIATATVYNTTRPYSIECADPGRAQIARYAWGDDYHEVIGRRLEQLLEWMRRVGVPFEARWPSIPASPGSASTPNTPGLAGSVRTPASFIPSSAHGPFSPRFSAVCRSRPTCRHSISAAPARCASKRARPMRWSRQASSTRRAAFRI